MRCLTIYLCHRTVQHHITHTSLDVFAACAAIRISELGLAEKLLKRAIDLCRETLSSDDYTEEEIEVLRVGLGCSGLG